MAAIAALLAYGRNQLLNGWQRDGQTIRCLLRCPFCLPPMRIINRFAC